MGHVFRKFALWGEFQIRICQGCCLRCFRFLTNGTSLQKHRTKTPTELSNTTPAGKITLPNKLLDPPSLAKIKFGTAGGSLPFTRARFGRSCGPDFFFIYVISLVLVPDEYDHHIKRYRARLTSILAQNVANGEIFGMWHQWPNLTTTLACLLAVVGMAGLLIAMLTHKILRMHTGIVALS